MGYKSPDDRLLINLEPAPLDALVKKREYFKLNVTEQELEDSLKPKDSEQDDADDYSETY